MSCSHEKNRKRGDKTISLSYSNLRVIALYALPACARQKKYVEQISGRPDERKQSNKDDESCFFLRGSTIALNNDKPHVVLEVQPPPLPLGRPKPDNLKTNVMQGEI